MTAIADAFTVLLDEGTPVKAADPFLHRGHRVIYHSDVLAGGATDDVVVVTAILKKAILIAVDGDMKRMVKRFGAPNNHEKYSKLNLVFVSCKEVLAAKRLKHALTFIEGEWRVACEKSSRRLWVDIGAHSLTTYR